MTDEFMGFDPQDLSVFRETEKQTGNVNIYNTNPVKFSTSDDKHYHSRVRVIYNPHNPKNGSIIKQVKYVMSDEQGLFFADSKLAIGKKDECPLFKGWKQLHFSGDPEKDAWSKQMFEKHESQWCTVQVIEDDNRPELVGKFFGMKLPKAIWNKMEAKMNPTPESKKQPQAIMDYIFGPILNIDVIPGPAGNEQRQISYDLCDFDTDPYPVIKIDGTQLLSDEELEVIDKYFTLNQAINKAKTEKAKAEKAAEKNLLVDSVKAIYSKVLEYLKENCLNIEEECGFKEWNETLTNRVNKWLTAVLAMKDPRIPELKGETITPVVPDNTIPNAVEDDFPF